MSKPLLGILLGAGLGVLDGLTALMYPETRPIIMGILIGSTFKGLIAGALIGFFAHKISSIPLGLIVGLVVGMGLAYAVAAMPDEQGRHYYLEIIIPGTLVGLILG
jgi:uncharacterized membrane protein (UPF0136 family)